MFFFPVIVFCYERPKFRTDPRSTGLWHEVKWSKTDKVAQALNSLGHLEERVGGVEWKCSLSLLQAMLSKIEHGHPMDCWSTLSTWLCACSRILFRLYMGPSDETVNWGPPFVYTCKKITCIYLRSRSYFKACKNVAVFKLLKLETSSIKKKKKKKLCPRLYYTN